MILNCAGTTVHYSLGSTVNVSTRHLGTKAEQNSSFSLFKSIKGSFSSQFLLMILRSKIAPAWKQFFKLNASAFGVVARSIPIYMNIILLKNDKLTDSLVPPGSPGPLPPLSSTKETCVQSPLISRDLSAEKSVITSKINYAQVFWSKTQKVLVIHDDSHPSTICTCFFSKPGTIPTNLKSLSPQFTNPCMKNKSNQLENRCEFGGDKCIWSRDKKIWPGLELNSSTSSPRVWNRIVLKPRTHHTRPDRNTPNLPHDKITPKCGCPWGSGPAYTRNYKKPQPPTDL